MRALFRKRLPDARVGLGWRRPPAGGHLLLLSMNSRVERPFATAMKLRPTLILAAVLAPLFVPATAAAPRASHDGAPESFLTWFDRLQRADGSWPANPALVHPGAKGHVIPGRGADSLAITAAMTLANLADGHTCTRGNRSEQVCRAADYLTAALDRSPGPNALPQGGALALYALAECAYWDRERTRQTATLTGALDRALDREVAAALSAPASGSEIAPGEPLTEAKIEDLGWLALAAAVRVESGDAAVASNFAACVAKLEGLGDGSVTAAAFSLTLQVRDASMRGLEDLSHFRGEFHEVCRLVQAAPVKNPALGTLLASAGYRIGGKTWKAYHRRVLGPLSKRRSMTVLAPLADDEVRRSPISFWPWSGDSRGTLWDTAWNVQSLAVYYRYSRLAFSR